MDLYNSNIISIHENFFLNSFSFIDSTFQYNDTQDTSTEKYLYNTTKQLVKLIEYDYTTAGGAELYNTHNYLYNANGNLTKETDDDGEITYEYCPVNVLKLLSGLYRLTPTPLPARPVRRACGEGPRLL